MRRFFAAYARLAWCTVAVSGAAPAGQVTARIVAQPPVGHYRIYGLAEGSPGTLYPQTDGNFVFSVVFQRSITDLLTLPA